MSAEQFGRPIGLRTTDGRLAVVTQDLRGSQTIVVLGSPAEGPRSAQPARRRPQGK